MIDDINNEYMRFSKLQGQLLYNNLNEAFIDIYYLEDEACPIDIMKEFGTAEVDKFAFFVFNEIKKRNNVDIIWRFHQTAFAVPYSSTNIGSFEINYKGIKKKIAKKKVLMKVEI